MSDAPEEAPARKIGSLKDRIAMFNQPKQAASPPPKPTKPRTFKWRTSDATDESKSSNTLSLPNVPPPAPSPSPGGQFPAGAVSSLTERSEQAGVPESGVAGGGATLEPVSSRASAKSTGSTESQGGSGLSAADARQTAGSLKDRIALLSGLKVDQPGPPGRAPKPWKKKEEPAPEAQDTATPLTTENAAAAVPTDTGPASATDKPDIKIDTDAAQDLAPATETPEEPISAEAPKLPRPSSPTDNLANVIDTAPKSPLAEEGGSASASPSLAGPAGGIAMPAMPTRARGPPRKGRSGGNAATTSAVTSPSSEQPSSATTQQADNAVSPLSESREAPSIAEIGSPAGEPDAFMASPADQRLKEAEEESDTLPLPPPPPPPVSDPVSSAGIVAGSEPVERSAIKRSLTGQGNMPLPPPTPASMADDDDELEVEDDIPEDEDAAELTSGMAEQSLEDRPVPAPVPAPAPSRAMPPLPARIDTSMSEEASEPSPSSPSSTSNRRSMARPPVPQAFQRAPSVTSPLSGSFSGSFPPAMSPRDESPTEDVSAQPSEDVGDGEFANPAIDEAGKSPIQPPVSRPFDTAIMPSPSRKSSELASSSPSQRGIPLPQMPSSPHARQRSLPSPGLPPMSPPLARSTSPEQPGQQMGEAETAEAEEEYEDPEAARRQALAKRMAAMGGMNMMPMFGGPGPMKRKQTLPKQEAEQIETPASPTAEKAREDVPASSTRPAAAPAMPSYRPPAGAFVLPGIGKPQSAVSQPDPMAEEAEEADTLLRGTEEMDETADLGDETVMAGEQDLDEAGEDHEEEEDSASAPPPPPLPTGRPIRMPPVPVSGQSFIDVDTSTEGAGSKRTSMTSNMSAGMGDLPTFPNPPHTRTVSSASRLSGYDQEVLHEEPEMMDEEEQEGYEQDPEEEEGDDVPPALPPARPSRALPAVETSSVGSGSDSQQQVPPSPARSASVYSNRSTQATPMSPTGHGRQVSLSQMSPTSSRRSSTNVTSQGSGPVPAAGLTHEYLAHLAVSASKSKSRDIDGALATVINDIHNQRNNPSNFGHPVWRTYVSGEKGVAPDLQINGRIETGCIFSAWDAKFDRGLGRSSLRVGSLEVPHVGIVCEDVKDVKKAKVKIVELVQGRHQVETYKLDDIKLGTVEIRRLP